MTDDRSPSARRGRAPAGLTTALLLAGLLSTVVWLALRWREDEPTVEPPF
ncbi:hypothetical protein [Natronococcus jeotgali]|nr:hypothetical protein [Natronococcus jeotgali]